MEYIAVHGVLTQDGLNQRMDGWPDSEISSISVSQIRLMLPLPRVYRNPGLCLCVSILFTHFSKTVNTQARNLASIRLCSNQDLTIGSAIVMDRICGAEASRSAILCPLDALLRRG